MATVSGTNNSDLLDALDGVTNGVDSIFGLGGNDIIFGLGGGNSIDGGNGDDTILGGLGNDVIHGGADIDTASYSDFNQGVTVGVQGGPGSGGTAQGDTLDSIENLTGSGHNDFLMGDGQKNVLSGLGEQDTLKGYGGNDTLNGGSGHDTLRGGEGGDVLNGGAGKDTADYSGSNEGVIVTLIYDSAAYGHAEGDDLNSIEHLTGSAHADQLAGNNAANVLEGGDGPDILKGYGGDDTLLGGGHNNDLSGMDGNDTLESKGGQDKLDGGAGDDEMTGGKGNDEYIVDSAGDLIDENFDSGYDEAFTSVSYDLGENTDVETLRTTNDIGAVAISLTGNWMDNYLRGNAGTNVLDGVTGDDVMSGLNGNDTYYVDSVSDVIAENAGLGSDVVRSSTTFVLNVTAEVESLQTTDVAASNSMTLVGNEFAQTIVGNAGINVLRGFAGSDQLQGMGGNDTLTGHAGNDKFLFNTALNAATNVDTITDFTVVDDLVRLENAIFTQAGAVGALDADAFHIGAAAADAQDRIVYNSATGDLFYDSNGSAAGGSTLFARLDTGLALTNADFAIV